MKKSWSYFLFLLWFTYLIISSTLLFSRGFLLTKNAQFINTTCLTLPEIPCLDNQDSTSINGYKPRCNDQEKLENVLNDLNSASSICLPQKSRIIIMVVDALRYDFIVHDETLQKPLPYQNKLPIIDKLAKQQPENTRTYKFLADPPTTTMQRIKGLTTGSLPTFIDVGANFASSEINEDNIIDQALRNGHNTVFMGDDTWDNLFPNRFLRKYPFPSFDVWDLDTVDKGVNSHIIDELHKSDWSLMVAHYLGVDHCGHRYGPEHNEMDRKLTEINAAIQNVIEEMDLNTILFVMGDHGMTLTGDHGGESDDEITSAFFAFSKTKFLHIDDQTTEIRQVDLVPTISSILGIPIPYSSVGSIVLNILPSQNYTHIPRWRIPLFHLWANVQQFWGYVENYAKNYPDTFSEASIQHFRRQFSILSSKLHSVVDDRTFADFLDSCQAYIVELRANCLAIWVQFDSFSMTRGLLFLFLSMFFVYTITDGIPSHRLPEIFASSFLFSSYCAMFLAAGFVYVLYYFEIVSNFVSNVYFATCMVSQVMLVMLLIQNWELISLNWYDKSRRERIPNLICRLVLIFHLGGLFSNSFIIEEATVLLFLLCTVILVGSFAVSQGEIRKKGVKSKAKLAAIVVGVLVLLRVSVFFWRCRDREDQPWCYELYNPFTSKAETSKMQWLFTVIALAAFVSITKIWMRNCGNLNGFSATVTHVKYAPTVVVVCMSGFWVLNRLNLNKGAKLWQANLLAWTVYGFCISGVLLVVLKPMCIYILPSNKNVAGVSSDANVIPELFRKVKKLFNRAKDGGGDEVPVVCGLGTVYSVVFVAIGMYFTLLFALLQGDAIAPSIVVMFLASAFILIVTSMVRLETANSIDELMEIPNMSVLIWVILSQYFFYGTGHQATFPNIVWDPAFVGTSGIFKSNLISAGLVVISTFCSHILLGFLVPLLIIMPFTLSVMFPTIVKKGLMLKENLRGEVLLYEREELMLTVTFTTICKYVVCHGIRLFACMMSATVHCRHMMVWRIFAPKFIFEGLGMCVTLAIVNVSFLILMRINSKVDSFVLALTKKYT